MLLILVVLFLVIVTLLCRSLNRAFSIDDLLLDILFVRHCCFIIGPSGSSKTETWKSLMVSLKEIGQDGQWEQVNPKAITSNELYGIMTKTKEWKDGAVAVIMRTISC